LILLLKKLGVTLTFCNYQCFFFSLRLALLVYDILSPAEVNELSLVFVYKVNVEFKTVNFGFMAGLNCNELLLYAFDQEVYLLKLFLLPHG